MSNRRRTSRSVRNGSDELAAGGAPADLSLRLCEFIDRLPAIVWTTDDQLRYTTICGGGLRELNIRPEDVLGQAVDGQLIATDGNIAAHRRVLGGSRESYAAEWQGHWFEVALQPLLDAPNQIAGCLGLAVKVTDGARVAELIATNAMLIKRAHEQELVSATLRESEERYRLLAENSTDLISRIDPQGVCRYVSPAIRSLLGYTAAEVVGRSVLDFLHVDDWPQFELTIANVVQGGNPQTATLRTRCRTGEYIWLETIGRAVFDTETSRVREVVTVSRDVTARIEAEQMAQALRDELAHVSRLNTLGGLASGLAHELMQPLSTIVGFAEGCIRRLGPKRRISSADLLLRLNEIVAQAQLAGAIIRRMRNFVRKREIAPSSVAINLLIEDVLGLMQAEFRVQCIDLVRHFAAELPLVRGDQVQLQQVLLNLMRNAVEAMTGVADRSHRLTIQTRSEPVRGVVVAISDAGCGVAPEHLNSLGIPFFTTKPHGLGLGLSISKSIVAAHGGRLWAEPNSDFGMTFQFNLPESGATES